MWIQEVILELEKRGCKEARTAINSMGREIKMSIDDKSFNYARETLMDNTWEFKKETKKVEALAHFEYLDGGYHKYVAAFDRIIPDNARIFAEFEE